MIESIKRAYLLDTSVFRAASTAQLLAASKSKRLLASPFCFWEQLTHLEKTNYFERVKGNLMKFRHVGVLDDPGVSAEREVVRKDDGVHQRPLDSNVVYATLAALRDSASIVEFYAKYIRDSRNQTRQIAGCVDRVRTVLETEERRFQDYLGKVVALVRGRLVPLSTPAERHTATLQIAEAWWHQLRGRCDGSEYSRQRVVRRTYVYSSYVLHLALDCVERGAMVERNDFEDAQFCRHLLLDAEMTAVTADARLERCLRNCLENLRGLNDDTFTSNLHVSGPACLAQSTTVAI